jgi:osmotically-inducible protein OsmY
MKNKKTLFLRLAAAAAVAALALPLAGCVGVAAVGVGAAALSVEDRRTTGTQVEDEGIELRASNRVSERFSDKAHVNITSFNRNVLITGEASNEQTRADIEKMVAAVPGVRGVTNDMQIGGVTALTSRANDAGITGKVKARFLDAGRFSPVHVKVVTENGVVYLLGMVTEAEANSAVEVARTTGGVRKVVKVFEYCKPTDAACAPRSKK